MAQKVLKVGPAIPFCILGVGKWGGLPALVLNSKESKRAGASHPSLPLYANLSRFFCRRARSEDDGLEGPETRTYL